jgi:hypothetical protein
MDTRLLVAVGNAVSWGTLAGEDFENMLLGTDRAADVEALEEHGTAAMPFAGDILCIHPMGTLWAAYGADGVALYQQNGATYGAVSIDGLPAGVGISGRAAIAGGDSMHVFHGTDGALWALTADGKCRCLHHENLLSGALSVSHDPRAGEFWTSNGYLLTELGLGGPLEPVVLSVGYLNGQLVGIGTGYAAADTLVELWTNDLSGLEPGQKRITFLRFGVGQAGEAFENMRLRTACRYRADLGSALTQTCWRPCSRDGWGEINTMLSDGRLGLIGRMTPGTRITRLEARHQLGDGRSRRGPTGIPKGE